LIRHYGSAEEEKENDKCIFSLNGKYAGEEVHYSKQNIVAKTNACGEVDSEIVNCEIAAENC
jgi:hypothetical protein